MTTDRRSVLALFTTGLAAVAAASLLGCGDDDGDGAGGSASTGTGGSAGSGGSGGSGAVGSGAGGSDSGSCETDGTTSTIENNHGHTLVVPAEDVTAGVEQSYDITGTSAHPHSITLTPAHFETLRAGQPVTVTSSVDSAHDHDVTVECAA